MIVTYPKVDGGSAALPLVRPEGPWGTLGSVEIWRHLWAKQIGVELMRSLGKSDGKLILHIFGSRASDCIIFALYLLVCHHL